MKYSFLLFIGIFIFTSCSTITPLQKAPPLWYQNQTIKIDKSYKVLGYAAAQTLFQAKAIAKSEIAQTISSSIESSYIQKLTLDKNLTNEVFNSTVKTDLKVTTKLDLQNLETLKQEYKNGQWFVLLSYENLDLNYKIKNTITDFKCGNIDNYLKKTTLYKKLNNDFTCDIPFKLQRKDKVWYLKYNADRFLLTKSDFEKLFISSKSPLFDFKISKKVLKDRDSFYFSFFSKKEGYITLLNVYENGIVTVLKSSQKINKNLQIPSAESENYFEAGLVEDNKDSFDLYVAIYSEKPLEVSRFTYADEMLMTNEIAYKFDELIDVLNDYSYATLLVRTEK